MKLSNIYLSVVFHYILMTTVYVKQFTKSKNLFLNIILTLFSYEY